MIRHAAAVVVALCLFTAPVAAQNTEITINAASASVHKSPSAGSPVIGRANRGTTLEVTREVGDWVKVAWPAAADGSGYVRTNAGSIGKAVPVAARTASSASRPAAQPAPAPAPRLTTSANAEPQRVGTVPPRPQSSSQISTPKHQIGLGARLGGSAFGLGASARAWSRGPLGVQFDVSRFSQTDPTSTVMTSTQFGPSALYTFGDRISDYIWLRPYAGAGATFNRSTMTPFGGLPVSDSNAGFQAFGGGEFSVASLPQLAVSADMGYHWFEPPFAGLELGGFSVSVAAHWYIK
jgi:hypothetical protein